MKSIYIFTSLLAIILLSSCQQNQNQHTNSNDIPKLLIRPQIIGPEDEMGSILDQYNLLAGKIRTAPEDMESRLALAELFMMEARISGEHGHYYPAALSLVEDVLKQDPEDPIAYRALLDKSSVLLSLHQFAEAKEVGEQALKINKHSADIYGVLTDAHVELGMYDEAIMYADKMVSIRPDLRSYSRVSYLREIHGMVSEAIDAMKMAVNAGYPGLEQTEWARLTLGHLYERYGDLENAMVQYETALAVRPNYPFAISALSNAYRAKGEHEKADSLSDVAIFLIPEVGFYIDRASREKEIGNLEKAKEMTEEIFSMLADDEKAGHKMGIAKAMVYLSLLDVPEKALAYALEEYQQRPKNIEVNKTLAEIYFALGNVKKSNEHLTIALGTGSKDPEALCLKGIVMTETNQKEEGYEQIKSVFVEIPYLDCRFCKEARAIIL